MKTKTIYHLDQDCNIVKIEVIEKQKKNKKRPIVINLERLTDKVQVINKGEYLASIFSKMMLKEVNTDSWITKGVKQSQNENSQCIQEECLSNSHIPVELSQNKGTNQLQLPEMLLCSEAYQNFVNLLGRLSPLDAEKQIYSMFLARIPLMEQEVCRTEQKSSPASASGWRKNFQFD